MRHTPEVLEELRQAAHETYREINRVRPHLRSQPRSKLHPVLAILVAVAAVAAAVWFLFLYGQQGSDQVPRTTTTTTTTAPPQDAAPAMTEQIQAVIDDLGRGSVSVEESSGTIYLIGAVPTEADRQDVIGAAEALAGATPVNSTTLSVIYHDDDLRIAVLNAISAAGFDRLNATVTSGVATLSGVTPGDGAEDLAAAAGNVEGVTEVVDTTEKADRAPALAAQLERVTALTPILFEEGQVGLNESQEGILDDAADIIGAHAGPMVTITAYAANETVAADWAELARDRLTAQGVAAERLVVAAATERGSSGPESATGSGGHVEFEAGYAVAARGTPDFRIGIVAAGSRDDYATTQSIVDAALVIPIDRTDVGVDISDGIVTPTDAEFAIRGYARDGYDLVIVHGSEFGPFVQTIAADYPNVAFAWGGSDDTFDLPNVSAYQVAADQGGYVLGTLAAQLTENGVVGIVGSTDTGEDARYVDGFAAGIRAVDPQLTILTGYTGSTDDTALAEQTVAEYIASGADVLSASGGSTLGVLEAANQNDVPWFGNQADQARLAPGVVVASQVYHWEVALRQIVAGIDQGTLGGQTYTLDLANGGIVVDYSPYYPLAPELVTEAGNVTAGLIDGSTNTGV